MDQVFLFVKSNALRLDIQFSNHGLPPAFHLQCNRYLAKLDKNKILSIMNLENNYAKTTSTMLPPNETRFSYFTAKGKDLHYEDLENSFIVVKFSYFDKVLQSQIRTNILFKSEGNQNTGINRTEIDSNSPVAQTILKRLK